MKQRALRIAQTFHKTVSVDTLKRWAKKKAGLQAHAKIVKRETQGRGF